MAIAFNTDYNGAGEMKVWAKSLGKSFTPPGFCQPASAVRAACIQCGSVSKFIRAKVVPVASRISTLGEIALLTAGLFLLLTPGSACCQGKPKKAAYEPQLVANLGTL